MVPEALRDFAHDGHHGTCACTTEKANHKRRRDREAVDAIECRVPLDKVLEELHVRAARCQITDRDDDDTL